MIPLTTSKLEKPYPGVTVKFATYTEGGLRANTTDFRSFRFSGVLR
jgi:hypothetical protein